MHAQTEKNRGSGRTTLKIGRVPEMRIDFNVSSLLTITSGNPIPTVTMTTSTKEPSSSIYTISISVAVVSAFSTLIYI